MPHLSRFGIWILIIILFVALAFCLLRPAGRSLSREQIFQMQSDVQLKGISKLLVDFEAGHGGLAPRHLSDVVPDNRNDLLEIFYAPGQPTDKRPVGWSTNKELIDLYSDYVLESYGRSNLIVHEKSGLWPDNTLGVIFSNLTVERISGTNLDFHLKANSTSNP